MADVAPPPEVIFGLAEISEAPDGAVVLGHVKRPEKAPRRRSRFTQRDVTRAFKAAQKAGVDARVDIATDGTLSIVSVTPEEAREHTHPETNEWDDVLGNATIPLRQ